MVQVGFYSDGDTSWVNEVGLELTNAQKQDVDKTALAEKIQEAKNKVNGSYTAESIAELQIALARASEIYADPVALQNELDEQTNAIQAAMDQLVAIIDFSALNEALTAAEEKQEADYTPSTYQALQEAIAEAKEIKAKENVTQDEIDATVSKLNAKSGRLD